MSQRSLVSAVQLA